MRRKTMSLAVMLACASHGAASAAEPIGGCRFDSASLRFAGSVQETADCLLRKVRPRGAGGDPQPVPAWLSARLLTPVAINAAQLQAYLAAQTIDVADLSASLTAGDASQLRFFVIHDTSSPEIESAGADFPADIDLPDYPGNRLAGWASLDGRVNLLINRAGQSRRLVDWGAARSRPATKLEGASKAPRARPQFVHVENIQPRIKPPGSWGWRAPSPGLSPAQEERLALAYILASFRAGKWLIPAYHFNIDQGLPDAHDDPQNMNLQSWAAKVEQLEAAIGAAKG